jgi:hypothetical protein
MTRQAFSRRQVIAGTLSAALIGSARRAEASSRVESDGGFAYLTDPGSPFSAGVGALPGHELTRIRLHRPLPLDQGLELAAKLLAAAGRPPTALAALELRAPKIMSRQEFSTFNGRYLEALRSRGFVTGDGVAVARSNMVPAYEPPSTDFVAAFTYAAPSGAGATGGRDFLLSGRPEFATNPDRVIAPGDISAAGMGQKAEFVFGQLRQTVNNLGRQWSDVSDVQLYLTQPLESVMPALKAAGLAGSTLILAPGSAPVIGFDEVRYEFEADIRRVSDDRVI